MKLSEVKEIRGWLEELEDVARIKRDLVIGANGSVERGGFYVDVQSSGFGLSIGLHLALGQVEAHEADLLVRVEAAGLDVGTVSDDEGQYLTNAQAAKIDAVTAWRSTLSRPPPSRTPYSA